MTTLQLGKTPMQKWPKTKALVVKGKAKGYMGNPYLKKIGENIEMDQFQYDEYKKCRRDPIYFLEHYAKIVSLDDGIVPFKLFPFQKKLIRAIQQNRKIIGKLFRQAGKSTTLAGFIAWYVLFNANKRAGILANKLMVAKEIFSRVQFIIENTPKWLQQGVTEWNKTSFTLENGSACFACATSASAVRGLSLNFLFLDEFAHLGGKLAEEFISSVFPTISSSQTSKLVIVSTPKGMNHYYKMWTEAVDGSNGFAYVESHWSEHPKRTQAWADSELASLGRLKYNQEIECKFLGSSATLIDGEKIATIPHITPIGTPIPFLNQFALPEKGHAYVITVDVSRGVDLDYSTFTVIDISVHPYNIAAVYRHNLVSTLVYPEIIYKVAKWYNDAYVLVETNDLGQQVADILFYDLEYENMYMSSHDKIKEGGDAKLIPGLKTTKKSKTIGCDLIKNIIEGDNILINDMAIIHEMSTFARIGASFKAEEGKNDDLMMCIHRRASIYTEDGAKSMKWVVDNKYSGRVLSLDEKGQFVWAKVVAHVSRPNTNKTWVRVRGDSRNSVPCTSDHLIASVDDVFDPVVAYTEAKDMVGKFNVALPGQRFHRTNPLFNKDQISALVGIMLGDGSINKKGKFYCAHGKNQAEYTKHKVDLLNGSLRISKATDKKTESHWVDVGTNAQTKELREMMYSTGKKSVERILGMIDEISLAYWYMDDGYTQHNSGQICTDSFSYQDHVLLQQMFSERFGVTPSIRKQMVRGKEYYRLYFGVECRDRFFSLIAPYIHESMEYKLPEKFRGGEKKILDNKPLGFGCERITSVKEYTGPGTPSRLYDITVEGNHNFVANGMLVHNCLVIFGYLTGQSIFKDLFNESLREKFVANQIREVESQFLPIGFFDNGSTGTVDEDKEPFAVFKDKDGEKKTSWDLVWTAVE